MGDSGAVGPVTQATGWSGGQLGWDLPSLSRLLEDGYSIRAANTPGANDLMMRIYAAMAQKERELISERTKAALAAARGRGKALGGDRRYCPTTGPDARAAALARREGAERTGYRLALKVEALREAGTTSLAGFAQALTERGVSTPRDGRIWPHTTVARVLSRVSVQQVGG